MVCNDIQRKEPSAAQDNQTLTTYLNDLLTQDDYWTKLMHNGSATIC